MVPLGPVVALMVAMALKHFCADFLFQTSAIARGKAAADHWILPLAIHAFGHAIITFAIAMAFYPAAWWVAVAEFVIHAVIDRGKALIGTSLRLDSTKTSYWWLFGFDQLLHQLTNVAIMGVFLFTAAPPTS